MSAPFLTISNLTIKYPNNEVLVDLDWKIFKGENYLICGKSGSGKTSLAKAIANYKEHECSIKFCSELKESNGKKALYLSSWYQFTNLEGDRNFYYQQRYTKQQNKNTLSVYEDLVKYGKEEGLNLDDLDKYLTIFGFSSLQNTQLIELSSGEHKKLQLIKGLWEKPHLLIIDQPYSGLDSESRRNLNLTLDNLANEGMSFILISNEDELPNCINRFAEIENGKLKVYSSRPKLKENQHNEKKEIPLFLQKKPVITSETMVSMRNINVSYGDKQILKNINWQVKAGEKWLLQGDNGSGKSTLLSLINGDHPQAYSSGLTLFGKKRGSGESIWEIKEHLGIISPEMHWYFDNTLKVWQSIASGYYHSVGLFKKLSHQKQKEVNDLLSYFGLTDYKNETINTLSLGKQRLVLLARTIIKNPELLILDEPCQGLDSKQTKEFNNLVDELCTFGTTLIYVGHFETQIPTCIEKRIILENGEVKSIEYLKESILT